MRAAFAITPLLLMAHVFAQSLPTTLSDLCRRADVIVRARMLSANERGDDGRRVVFLTQETLRGATERIFSVAEDGAVGCASTLARLLPGSSCILFLSVRAGDLRAVDSDPRAVLVVDPGVLAHVRALLAARDDGDLVRSALSEALASPSSRVRSDAIRSLAMRADLGRASLLERERIRAALELGLTESDGSLFDLLELAMRLNDPSIDNSLVAASLTAKPTVAGLALNRLANHRPPEVCAGLIAAALATSPQHARQVLACTADLPTPAAVAIRAALQASGDPGVRALAARAEPLQIGSIGVPIFRCIRPRSR